MKQPFLQNGTVSLQPEHNFDRKQLHTENACSDEYVINGDYVIIRGLVTERFL